MLIQENKNIVSLGKETKSLDLLTELPADLLFHKNNRTALPKLLGKCVPSLGKSNISRFCVALGVWGVAVNILNFLCWPSL